MAGARRGRVAMATVLAAVAVSTVPVAAASDCRSTGFSAESFGNPDYAPAVAAVDGSTAPPDVLIDQSDAQGRRLARLDGRSGTPRWSG
jgi:hypothetical protein